MFQTQLLRISQLSLLACASLPALAASYTIQGNNYVPGTVTETVSASFTTPTGGTTTNTYSGYVLLTVSGTGAANGGALNDAFYLIGPPQTRDPNFFQLAVDSANLTANEPLADVVYCIAYDVDANAEAPRQPYLPLYRPNNTYQIIIDTSLLPSHGSVAAALRFGVSDATFTDNSGSFNIIVTQLNLQTSGPAATQSYVITTIAGNGTGAFLGDGGPAAQAELRSPGSVALDSQGRLYISDGGNNRIRMVSNGNITTVAGTTSPGITGDGGPATSAYLDSPGGITIDPAGNLYIADTLNSIVREVSNGTINTIAGSITTATSTNYGPGYSGDGGPANVAQLLAPAGVALDSFGNLYIADQGNSVIREVSNGIITTFGSNNPGALKLKTPAGVAVDKSGNLFIADKGNHRIVEVTPAGVWSVIAGTGASGFSGDNGPAIKATLSFPGAVAVDAAGQVYIADSLNSRIRLVNGAGIITTIAGTGRPSYSGDGGPATSAAMFDPPGLAVDTGGNVYVADAGNERVRFLQALPVVPSAGVVNGASFKVGDPISPGSLATIFGSGFGAAAASASSAPFPKTLGNVSVNVNSAGAALVYVSPAQINFQVPWETTPGTASITVTANGQTSPPVSVQVVTAAPGLFFNSSTGQAIVQNQDYSLNTSANPAKVGSTIVAYLTGSGPLDHPLADGAAAAASPLSSVTSIVSAAFGTVPAQVIFAGLTPGFVGLLQMNVTVPATLNTQDYQATFTINGQKSNAATISVTK
jgi:uncharacterized protein (TIGR03437 family)